MSQFDIYDNPILHPGMGASATHGKVITPQDGINLTQVPRWIWIGSPGTGATLTVTLVDDTVPVTISSLSAGRLDIRPLIIWATGTSASNIIAFW